MKRNRQIPFIIIVCTTILIFMIVHGIKNTKIYIVYSSGMGPFLIMGIIILILVVLFAKKL
jgi:hypothetical protein